MFIQIEGDRLVNLDLIEVVEMIHHKGVANIYAGAMIIAAESSMVYAYFDQHPDLVQGPEAVHGCDYCGARSYTKKQALGHVAAAHGG